MIKYLLIPMLLFVQVLYGQFDQSERLFNSEIFNAYKRQYNENVLPLSEKFQISEENPRLFYRQFLTTLRSSGDINSEAYRWLFLRVELTDEIIQNAKQRLNIPLDEKGFSRPAKIAKIIDKSFKETLANSDYDGYILSNEKYLDPILDGNFPYLLHKNSFAGNEVQFIRMPAPARTISLKTELKTIDDVKVNEEFEAFLTLHSAEDKKHLYVSFLNEWKSLENQFFHEKLALLEQHPKFGYSFFYVGLDKDTTFYHQKEEFATLHDSQNFLNTFLNRLTHCKNYRWPLKLNAEAWNQKCVNLVKDLHQKLFKGKKILTVEERQNFIEISYSRIIRALLEEIKPQTCNLTCHYTIDRGPSTTAIFLFDLLYQPEQGISNRDALKLIAFLLNQPILLQNRAAHDYRVNRVINVLNQMEHL